MAQVKEAGSVIEDGVEVTINKVQEALASVNVELLDHNGQIRDLQYVFNELGEVWDGLDRNSKAYLATIIAGLNKCFGSVKIPLIAGTSLKII